MDRRVKFGAGSPLGVRRLPMMKLNQRTSVSALMGTRVMAAQGAVLGQVCEFVVAPGVDTVHVQGLVLKLEGTRRGAPLSLVSVSDLALSMRNELHIREGAAPVVLPSD